MPTPKKQEDRKYIVQNRKARHDYSVLETYEAGIALTGTEVKSCRNAGVSLTDSYVSAANGQLTLIGTHIAPYVQANRFNHEPRRNRTLLMHKREIARLRKNVDTKGLTIIPLAFYFNDRGKVKVQIGLCRGRNVHDKRNELKKQMDERDMKRALNAKRN